MKVLQTLFNQTSITKKTIRFTIPFSLALLALGALLFVNACKKADNAGKLKLPHKYADSTASYTHHNYQQALDDVTVDGNGHMVFNNMSHLDVVLFALDSLGDSTAQVWTQSKSFNSIKSQFEHLANTYGAMDSDSTVYTQSTLKSFWRENSNIALITDHSFEINTSDPSIAQVLASDHLVMVGNDFIYSDYSRLLSAPVSYLSGLTGYFKDSSYFDTTKQIVFQKIGRKPSNGSVGDVCLALGNQYIPDINCGNPLEKKSTINFSVNKYFGHLNICSASNNWYVAKNMQVNIANFKRGIFGLWFPEKRGSQVMGYFDGVYFNQALIWANNQTNPSYTVYSQAWTCLGYPYVINLFNAQLNVLDCFRNGQVCVAPMCNGVTICESF